MNKIFILIIIIQGINGHGGVAINTQEFNSYENCIIASEKAKEDSNKFHPITTYCVEK